MNVVDANILVSAVRSRHGASNVVLRDMISGNVDFAVSPAIVLEYEDVLKRPGMLGENPWISHAEIDVVLDAIVSRARLVSPDFTFRPFLVDPKDDLYIDCALGAGARTIISNDRHFDHPAMRVFGLVAVSAGAFLETARKRRIRP